MNFFASEKPELNMNSESVFNPWKVSLLKFIWMVIDPGMSMEFPPLFWVKGSYSCVQVQSPAIEEMMDRAFFGFQLLLSRKMEKEHTQNAQPSRQKHLHNGVVTLLPKTIPREHKPKRKPWDAPGFVWNAASQVSRYHPRQTFTSYLNTPAWALWCGFQIF